MIVRESIKKANKLTRKSNNKNKITKNGKVIDFHSMTEKNMMNLLVRDTLNLKIMMILIRASTISHLKIEQRKALRIHLFQKRNLHLNQVDILNMRRKRNKNKIIIEQKLDLIFLEYYLIRDR